MAVTVETAAVFRGGGRRWLTLSAACAAEARAILKKHCACDYCEDDIGRYELPCRLHHPDRYPRIMQRLTKGLMRRYRASQS